MNRLQTRNTTAIINRDDEADEDYDNDEDDYACEDCDGNDEDDYAGEDYDDNDEGDDADEDYDDDEGRLFMLQTTMIRCK